jgi:hypothetical protein
MTTPDNAILHRDGHHGMDRGLSRCCETVCQGTALVSKATALPCPRSIRCGLSGVLSVLLGHRMASILRTLERTPALQGKGYALSAGSPTFRAALVQAG